MITLLIALVYWPIDARLSMLCSSQGGLTVRHLRFLSPGMPLHFIWGAISLRASIKI